MSSRPTLAINPALDDALRSELVQLWFDVSQKGGAVGFTETTPIEDVARGLDSYLEKVERGGIHLLTARLDDELAGCCALVENGVVVQEHFMELKRFMVHPTFQGRGL